MPRYSDKQLREALRKSRGMVYVAAHSLGCSPDTIKARLAKSEELRKFKTEQEELLKDVGETQLGSAVIRGDPWALKYYLSTKAKDRGYSERIEHSGAGGDAIEHRHTLDPAAIALLDAMAAMKRGDSEADSEADNDVDVGDAGVA